MMISRTHKGTIGRAVFGVFLLTLAGAVQADTGTNDWTAQQVVAAPDGTSRVLWTADSTTGLGKVASIWALNASGTVTSYGPTYGHYSDTNGDWLPQRLAVAADGTERLLWTTESASGQEASVWTLSKTGSVTSYGATYGPLTDSSGKWQAQDLQVAPDGTSRLLWKYFGTSGVKAGLWTLNAAGTATAKGTAYGPFSTTNGSMFPQQMAIAADGTTRLLWTVNGTVSATTGVTSGDTISVWTLDASGTKTRAGTSYGPYAGWAVAGFDIDTAHSTMPVLWYNTSASAAGDTASLWTLDATGTQKSVGASYGPYAGWSAATVSALPDGTSRVAWIKDATGYRSGGDTLGIWGFSSTGQATFMGAAYGPYSPWTLTDLSANRTDGTFRLLWDRTDGASSLWSLNTSGVQSSIGPIYGPFVY